MYKWSDPSGLDTYSVNIAPKQAYSLLHCAPYIWYIFWRFCRNRADNKVWFPKQDLFYVVSITVIQRLVQRPRIPLLDLFDTLDYFTY